MNIYDKRIPKEDQPVIIKSRVIKTESTVQPTQDGSHTISTAMHLDLGYIVYISMAEFKHIVEQYKIAKLELDKISDIGESEAEPPLDSLED